MAEIVASDVSVAVPCRLADLDRPEVVAVPSRLGRISQRNLASNTWTLVLDDDPTGTQTVRDVPVLTADWSEEQLDWASRHDSRMTFALTNSRSLEGSAAERLTFEIVTTAVRVARRNDLNLRVVSRSDSTLRGHFAIEIASVHRALRVGGMPARGTVFVPAFLEAGRVTARDVQWVSTGRGLVPAARTEFAQDTTFGYDEESLIDWVVGRTGDGWAQAPTAISLETLRGVDGVNEVNRRLGSLTNDQVVVANAVRDEDLEVLMLGLLDQEEAGHALVVRSGPSFVRLCAGQPAAPPVGPDALSAAEGSAPYGLLVVGSHTDLTNAQVVHAQGQHDLHTVELDASQIIHGPAAGAAEVSRCRDEILTTIAQGDVVLSTSRHVLSKGRSTPLLTSAAIADALVAVVQQVALTTKPRFLIAKGGITSSDMAVRALGVRRAFVLGQMLPGIIPLWKLLDGLIPGLPYVVFPGNVGAPDALSRVLAKAKK